MAIPKSVIKMKRQDKAIQVTYTDNVARIQYTQHELCRAALRDVGKFVCRNFKNSFYSHFHKRTGNVGKNTQYFVRHKKMDYPMVEVGIKPDGFYGWFQEFGTKTGNVPRLGLLTKSAEDHIPEIIRIESQYLSALEDEAEALSLISEEEYSGGAE